MTESMRLIDAKEVCRRMGCKHVKLYADVKAGLMTQPVRIGPKFSRWPDREVDLIVKAWVAGAEPRLVKDLVANLHAMRTRS